MPTTINNDYITTSSFIEYQTKKIKRTFDTQISEFSTDGNYDYLPGPDIKITYPNGNEKLWLDDTVDVRWNCEEADLMPSTSIYYLYDDKQQMLFNNVANFETSSVSWKINVPTSSLAKIMITGIFDSESFFDLSDNYFIVDKRYIDIQQFNTPIIQANVGNTFTLNWISNGVSNKVKIDMLDYYNNSLLKTIENDYIISSNTYTWKINDINKTTDKVRIKISDATRLNVYDISDIIDLLVPYIQNATINLTSYNPYIKIYPLFGNTYNPSVRITNFNII